MVCLLNIHTPSTSFSLPVKENESFSTLSARILKKSGLTPEEQKTFGKDGGGVKYEFEGGRYELADDDDLNILYSRYPIATTPSITLHLTPPHPPAHSTNSLYAPSTKSPSKKVPRPAGSTFSTRSTKSHSAAANGALGGAIVPMNGHGGQEVGESLGERKKREWEAFRGENGVRTVVGDIGKAKGVRMLLKSGYRHVYVSRQFALSAGLIPATSSMGHHGYSGLLNLGLFPIKVGGKSMKHSVYLSEEVNFGVVLGRSWMERCGVKTDPLDLTSVVYMDSGEKVDVDVVVLKGEDGEVITVT